MWEVFEKKVIDQSFQTLGILALVTVITLIAGKFIESRSQETEKALPPPAFRVIRRTTLIALIVAISLLAFVGVFAIWEILEDEKIVTKSLVSLTILAFSAFIIVITCLEREGRLGSPRGSKTISVGSIIFLILSFFLLRWLFGWFLRL